MSSLSIRTVLDVSSLSNSQLFEDSKTENVLRDINSANLLGAFRQLVLATTYSMEVMDNLACQCRDITIRIKSIGVRLDSLRKKDEKGSKVNISSSKRLKVIIPAVLTRNKLPIPLKESYSQCIQPPSYYKFRKITSLSFLKQYSDPSYFYEMWYVNECINQQYKKDILTQIKKHKRKEKLERKEKLRLNSIAVSSPMETFTGIPKASSVSSGAPLGQTSENCSVSDVDPRDEASEMSEVDQMNLNDQISEPASQPESQTSATPSKVKSKRISMKAIASLFRFGSSKNIKDDASVNSDVGSKDKKSRPSLFPNTSSRSLNKRDEVSEALPSLRDVVSVDASQQSLPPSPWYDPHQDYESPSPSVTSYQNELKTDHHVPFQVEDANINSKSTTSNQPWNFALFDEVHTIPSFLVDNRQRDPLDDPFQCGEQNECHERPKKYNSVRFDFSRRLSTRHSLPPNTVDVDIDINDPSSLENHPSFRRTSVKNVDDVEASIVRHSIVMSRHDLAHQLGEEFTLPSLHEDDDDDDDNDDSLSIPDSLPPPPPDDENEGDDADDVPNEWIDEDPGEYFSEEEDDLDMHVDDEAAVEGEPDIHGKNRNIDHSVANSSLSSSSANKFNASTERIPNRKSSRVSLTIVNRGTTNGNSSATTTASSAAAGTMTYVSVPSSVTNEANLNPSFSSILQQGKLTLRKVDSTKIKPPITHQNLAIAAILANRSLIAGDSDSSSDDSDDSDDSFFS